MAEISILSVCGSGVVTSHMVANKLVEMFEDEGYDVTTDECNPSELDGYLTRGSYDFIAYSARTSSKRRPLRLFTLPASNCPH